MISGGNKKANVLADVGGQYACKCCSCVAFECAIKREASRYIRCVLAYMTYGELLVEFAAEGKALKSALSFYLRKILRNICE